MASEQINDLARRQILAVAQRRLKDADLLGVVPTPLDQLAEEIGVRETIDISELPEELVVKKPSGLKKLLGAYLFRAETAFVDFSQPEGRARFIQAHELGHRIVPWHGGAYLDDERRLFRQTEDLFEFEANLAGAHLIFQGSHFFEHALGYPVSLKTPLLLADRFKASLHATIRYYIEHHPQPAAGLVVGQYTRNDGTVPIFLALESASFRERYGSIASRFPTFSLSFNDLKPLGPLLLDARYAVDVASTSVDLHDRNRQCRQFTAEGFFNQRCYFLMFAPVVRLRSGRRIQIAAA